MSERTACISVEGVVVTEVKDIFLDDFILLDVSTDVIVEEGEMTKF